MLHLNCFGLKHWFENLAFLSGNIHVYGVITLVLLIYLQILSSTHEQSTLSYYHFVREIVASKITGLKFISTKDQVADCFPKTLIVKDLDEFKHNLNISKVRIMGGC